MCPVFESQLTARQLLADHKVNMQVLGISTLQELVTDLEKTLQLLIDIPIIRSTVQISKVLKSLR